MDARANDRLFRAFADGRRLRILSLLRRGEMCVGDLVEVLRLPQSTVSRHLGLLRQAGLVACRTDAVWRHYSLAEPSTPLHGRLIGCLADCFGDLAELERDARAAERQAARGGCCPPGGGATCAAPRTRSRKGPRDLPLTPPPRTTGPRTTGAATRGRRSPGR